MRPFLLQHRFKVLLLTLVSVLLCSPLILDGIAYFAPGAARNCLFALTICLLFAGGLVVRGGRESNKVFLVLFIASILIEIIATFYSPGEIGYWDHGLRILFLASLTTVLLRHLFRPEVVNFDTLCASLCVYLLIGLIWMNAYIILETIVPGSIVMTGESDRQNSNPPGELALSINMLYFSFTTLTAGGYGDVVPRTNVARMLAVTEGLLGQGYLIVIVSRLVGLHVAQAFSGPEIDNSQSSIANNVDAAERGPRA